MKYGRITSVMCVLGFVAANSAYSGCADLGYSPESDATALSGGFIFARSPTVIDPSTGQLEEWKEDHCALIGDTGNLYKVGDGTAVDPRALRGTWTDNGDGTVTYDYGSPATTYDWKLYAFRKGGILAGLCWEDASTNPPTTIATGDFIGPTGPCP